MLLILTAVELTVHFTAKWQAQQTQPELLEFQPEREQEFEHYLDSLHEAEYAARKAEYARQAPKTVIHLQPFDPNTADSITLVSVGLKPYMAKNLIRYRQAGKVFRQPDDLRTLYGMSDSLYEALQPYIQIDSAFRAGYTGEYRGNIDGKSMVKRDTVLDLNTADTTELQLLRGVGRYTAIQIIRYRQTLGGYYSVNQLYEISELPSERIDSLLPHFFADTTLITPINVNRASVKQLSHHPYISYRQAEQLYNLRRRKLRISATDDLSAVFTPDEYIRVRHYLLFDDK